MKLRKTTQRIWVTKTWQSKYEAHFFLDYPKYKILWNYKGIAKIGGRTWIKLSTWVISNCISQLDA